MPKEIKVQEYRIGSDFTGEDYIKSGVVIINNIEEIFEEVDLIIKVKEPQPQEYKILRKAQMISAHLHLAADSEQTRLLLESEAIAIAYDTVTDDFHTLLLLPPMGAIAGRLAVKVGSRCLEKSTDGRWILPGGLHGTTTIAKVLIIGDGIVSVNSKCIMVMGLVANVTILGTSLDRIRELNDMYTPKLTPLYSIKSTIEENLSRADFSIGAVLMPGASAPKIVTAEMVQTMGKKPILLDAAIDQDGCFETSKPTTHQDPNKIRGHSLFEHASNVARTAIVALNNATLRFIFLLLGNNCEKALAKDHNLRNGVNVHYNSITNKGVADSSNYQYHSPESVGLL